MALPRTAAITAFALILAACGSSTSTNTSPSSITRCAVNVQGGGTVPAEGGTTTITVNAARECSWSAETEGAWLSIKAGASGQGEGSVVVAAAPNPDPVARRGAVVLNERRHEVMQEAGECSITLADRDGTFPQSGGNGRVEVRASSTLCTWTAESSDDWIVLRSAGTGKGSAEVPFEIRPTNGPTRRGFITVADQRFEITQAEGCAFDLEPSAQTVGAEGGSGTVAIRTAANCPWTAESQVSWLSLSAREGSGPGSVSFSVQPTTAARTGTALIGGRTFTVTQSAPASPSPSPAPSPSPGPSPAPSPAPSPTPSPAPSCSYDVQPRSHSADAAGGDFSVSVTTTPACSWRASSNVSWITVSRGGSSTGRGSASFTVAANSGAARSGTVTVAGESVTVTQSQGCSFAISPESASVGAGGGSGRVTVTGNAGCDWTASSNASWIRLTAGASGSGNGEVSYVAEANSGDARVGTITIAGRTFTLNQEREPRCRYRVRPDDIDVPARGRILVVAVETSLDCQWRAISEDDWISVVLNIAGFGDGLVTLSVSPNDGKKRKGTVRIGREKVSITQEGDDD